MTREFHYVIIGGGILGATVAALSAAAGLHALVIRLRDTDRPRADTLRNQGWLQSGVMYPIKRFASPETYAAFATRTYISGRQLLRECGLTPPTEGGVLKVRDAFHLDQLKQKTSLLRLSQEEFRRLEADEARALMGADFEADASYFHIPDGPFDEAGVLNHFRSAAQAEGAAFVEVDNPVTLAEVDRGILIKADHLEIEAPAVVVTAGAGSIPLMSQLGKTLAGSLQRTPLMVADAPEKMARSIVVDLDRGFSAVRHPRGDLAPHAVVMGTRANRQNAPFEPADSRSISREELDEFAQGVPPGFMTTFAGGRYTAGYEVVPDPSTGRTLYEPWTETHGRVIFASPGRATVSAMAALEMLPKIQSVVASAGSRTCAVDLSDCALWECPISMHYMSDYTFNDAKEA